MKSRIDEIENVLCNQIEMLNDDSLFDDNVDMNKQKAIIERSNSINNLVGSFIDLNQLRLNVLITKAKMKDNYGLLLDDK